MPSKWEGDLSEDLREALNISGARKDHGPAVMMAKVLRVDLAWCDFTDEPNFLWLLLLVDGTWAAVSAWHDYTGWDCQAGTSTSIFPTREDAIAFGFTLEQRDELGVLLPTDKKPEERAS